MRKYWILAALLLVASPLLAGTRQRNSQPKADAPFVVETREAATVTRSVSEQPAAWMMEPKFGSSAKGLAVMLQAEQTDLQGTVPRGFVAMLVVEEKPAHVEKSAKPSLVTLPEVAVPVETQGTPDTRKKQPRDGD